MAEALLAHSSNVGRGSPKLDGSGDLQGRRDRFRIYKFDTIFCVSTMGLQIFIMASVEPRASETENFLKALHDCVKNQNQDVFFAEQVLRFAYYTGTSTRELMADPQIGQLVGKCMGKITTCIFHNAYSFDADHGPYYLILRSGLQYILDESKHESLVEAFKSQRFQTSIEKFDQALERWKNSNITSYDSIIHDDSELIRPTTTPKEHTWWFSKDEF